MLQTWEFAVCCDHFWKAASNLQKPDILPKPKICSKHENLPFAVTTFGRLLATPKTRYPAKAQNMLQTWEFAFYCDYFWKAASNLQKPDILPNAEIWPKHENLPVAVTTFGSLLTTSKNQISCQPKICSKREDLVFGVTTFGRLLATSKNQISCRRPKYVPNMRICFCCDNFWKAASNFQKPDIIPKAKICSKHENLRFAVTTFGSLLAISKSKAYHPHTVHRPFVWWCPLQKPDIMPKAKICSKHENLSFAVTTFGRLLATSKSQISCRWPKYGPN